MPNIQTTFIKRTRDAKMNAGIAAIAARLAKENRDILWVKEDRAKRTFMKTKAQIIKKYGAQARMEWQKIMNGSSAKVPGSSGASHFTKK